MSYDLPRLVPDHSRFEFDAQLGVYSHICCLREHRLELHHLATTFSETELAVLYDAICCPGGNQIPGGDNPPPSPVPQGPASDCVTRFLTYACSPPGRAAIEAFIARCDDYLRINLSLDFDRAIVTIGREAARAILAACGDPATFHVGATFFCSWFREAGAWVRTHAPSLTSDRMRQLSLLLSNPILTTYLVDCCR